MKRILQNIFIIFIFLAGLSLLLYPYLSNEWNTYRQKRLIVKYQQAVMEQMEEQKIDYESEWNRAKTYNDELYPYSVPESFILAEMREQPDERYWGCLNLAGDGVMGIVKIPQINVRLPIFHTTNAESLEEGVGHLEGSSLPIGGENTHSVISAHRGLASATLFTDLEQLEVGDVFYITVLDKTLCYEVDQISVVEPSDTSPMAPIEGEDLVTLMTCTPYGVNSHRLLVRGHRVPYEPEVAEGVQEEAKAASQPSLHTNYLLWVIVGLSVTAIFIMALVVTERIRRKRRIAEALREIELEG